MSLLRSKLWRNRTLAGVTLTLASLARVVESLPMRTPESAAAEAEDTIIEEGQSGASRALDAFKDAFSGAIRVTRPDEEQIALLTPEFTTLARANLALQLQSARLALLRGEQQVFEQSLDDADGWLELVLRHNQRTGSWCTPDNYGNSRASTPRSHRRISRSRCDCCVSTRC